jgi:hypothetical protein
MFYPLKRSIPMTETEKERKKKQREEGIDIDYDDIDVAAIMGQIKRKIAEESKEDSKDEIPQEESYPDPVRFEPGAEGPVLGVKGKMKRVLLKIMKPVSPLIKLLVLPVHDQVMQTDQKLHQTNMRLDQGLDRFKDIDKRLFLLSEYTKLLYSLIHNIVVELSKLKIEEENLRSKARIMEKDFEFLGRREKALEKEIFKAL